MNDTVKNLSWRSTARTKVGAKMLWSHRRLWKHSVSHNRQQTGKSVHRHQHQAECMLSNKMKCSSKVFVELNISHGATSVNCGMLQHPPRSCQNLQLAVKYSIISVLIPLGHMKFEYCDELCKLYSDTLKVWWRIALQLILDLVYWIHSNRGFLFYSAIIREPFVNESQMYSQPILIWTIIFIIQLQNTIT